MRITTALIILTLIYGIAGIIVAYLFHTLSFEFTSLNLWRWLFLTLLFGSIPLLALPGFLSLYYEPIPKEDI